MALPIEARILAILSLTTFTAGMAPRAIDPLLVRVAADFGIDPTQATILSSATAIAFALVQPVLGVVFNSGCASK